jgi:hypothetical protein
VSTRVDPSSRAVSSWIRSCITGVTHLADHDLRVEQCVSVYRTVKLGQNRAGSITAASVPH